jgi:hypothetical protein
MMDSLSVFLVIWRALPLPTEARFELINLSLLFNPGTRNAQSRRTNNRNTQASANYYHQISPNMVQNATSVGILFLGHPEGNPKQQPWKRNWSHLDTDERSNRLITIQRMICRSLISRLSWMKHNLTHLIHSIPQFVPDQPTSHLGVKYVSPWRPCARDDGGQQIGFQKQRKDR